MLINTYLDTEDFVHLYYPDDEPAAQGCGAGARLASKYPPRPPSPDYTEEQPAGEMAERYRAPPQPEPPPHRVRAADLYPRLRTHYDEAGLDVGFTPICGEFVQFVGRTGDGGTVAMSNYRLHAQPRRRTGPGTSVPLRIIDGVETSELRLVVLCKHGRQLQCTFATNEQCAEWWRRINSALTPIGSVEETFAAAYAAWAKEQPAASVHRALMKASHEPQRPWFGPEVERLGFTTGGAWRITTVNADYRLCSSYPLLLIVPSSIVDEDLEPVARFRALGRIPAVVWRHRGNGAIIARCSQPEVGWFGWRSSEDERLVAAYVTACSADRGLQPATSSNRQVKLLIMDARSYASAVTNRARGGGNECPQYYPTADIHYMSLPNIHHVRKSFHQMRALCAESSEQPSWHSNLERTLWLQYVGGVLRAAGMVARAVEVGRPVLVHCSDGWDRTPQIVASAQLILDPFYRTLDGFRILIEREWLDFGHKFADRCGHQFGPEDPNERSPIFLQWLDVVYQMIRQYPCHFEFNEAYLIKLATHVHSCMFGTFLCNTSRERAEARLTETTAQVWHLLCAPAYRNHLYSPLHTDVLWLESGVRHMRVWSGMFSSGAIRDDDRDDAPAVQRSQPPHNVMMTRTRSCDNLLSDGERRTAQRRSSDPSLAPDVMRLSAVVNGDRERTTLTDSSVDDLPGLPPNSVIDHVDGLNPDHFESSSFFQRDLASGSSSLERELGSAVETTEKPIEEPANIDTPATIDTVDATATVDRGDGMTDSSETDMAASVIRVGVSPDDTPEEPGVIVVDTFADVIGMAEAARETGRTRNISITWRSISESSNQSSTGFDIAETPPNRNEAASAAACSSHEPSPVDISNHNSTEGDVANHNVVTEHTNHNRENGVTNGVNGVENVAGKFLEVDLNGGATSSSISSESEGEAGAAATTAGAIPRRPRAAHARVASQLTLCPASPRRLACCHCSRRPSATSGIETSGESVTSSEVCWCGVCGGEVGASRVRCVCGAGGALGAAGGAAAGTGGGADPLDGLPPAADRLQARLHQIILYQKKVVEELSGQLREAREALRRATPPPAPLRASPSAPDPHQMTSSSTGSALGSGSSSGSASEVEVGEEARGVVWLPDSAAPRCQHCRNHFWLARRRHHCRRCGGIFCGSCSEMSSWGDCGAVRMCRRCRALR